jgi:hypothetical protein
MGELLIQMDGEYIHQCGLCIASGAIVYDTIISIPISTMNKEKMHDHDMLSINKDNQWYFGMKAQIGVDGMVKQVHTIAVTTLLCGDAVRSAYAGQSAVMRKNEPRAQNFTHKIPAVTCYWIMQQRTATVPRRKLAPNYNAFRMLSWCVWFYLNLFRGLGMYTNTLHVQFSLINRYQTRSPSRYQKWKQCIRGTGGSGRRDRLTWISRKSERHMSNIQCNRNNITLYRCYS